MASESESCAVSMIIGSLVAVPPHDFASLAAIYVGHVDIEYDEIDELRLDVFDSLCRVANHIRGELIMQRKLLTQAFTQRLVIVNNQDLLDGTH